MFFSFLDSLKVRRSKRTYESAVRYAEDLFQLCEHSGSLWLTYCGSLVCPCSLFSLSPVDALSEMRDGYVERKTGIRRKRGVCVGVADYGNASLTSDVVADGGKEAL